MNRKTSIISIIALLMLLSMVAPVMAEGRPRTTVTMGRVGGTVDPGKVFLSADKIEHTRNQIGEYFIYGSPWGDGNQATSVNLDLDLADWTGTATGHSVETYTAGTMEGIISSKFTGLGLYTYKGPTFTYNGVTVEDGDMFFGVLFSGISVRHGTSGDLDGLQMRGTAEAVVVVIPGPLYLTTIAYGTYTYW